MDRCCSHGWSRQKSQIMEAKTVCDTLAEVPTPTQDTKYCHTEKHDAQSHNPQQRDVKAHEDMSRGSMLVTPIVATSVDTTVVTNPRGDLRSKTRASYEMISVEQRRRVSRRLCQTRGVQTKSLRIPKSLGRQQFGAEGNYSKLRYAWN